MKARPLGPGMAGIKQPPYCSEPGRALAPLAPAPPAPAQLPPPLPTPQPPLSPGFDRGPRASAPDPLDACVPMPPATLTHMKPSAKETHSCAPPGASIVLLASSASSESGGLGAPPEQPAGPADAGAQPPPKSRWHRLPAKLASYSSGAFEVDERFTLPIASNVVGYALYKPPEGPSAAAAPAAQAVELSVWADGRGGDSGPPAEERLVDRRTLSHGDLDRWHGWKAFPLAAPCSAATRLRIHIETSPPEAPLAAILGPGLSGGPGPGGIRFYSDRAPTAAQRLLRLGLRAAAGVRRAVEAVVISTRLAAATALAFPPLLLVPAALLALAWHGHGPGAAGRWLGLGAAAFAGGPSRPPRPRCGGGCALAIARAPRIRREQQGPSGVRQSARHDDGASRCSRWRNGASLPPPSDPSPPPCAHLCLSRA